MDTSLYNKTIKCPVCNKGFEATKVKAKTTKVASRDSDFCVHYETLNPIFYDVIVCENCGYASMADKFEEISSKDIAIILDKISKRWTKRSLSGERTVDNAIDAFKIALLNLQVRNAKNADIAKVCMRLAWFYRYKKEEKEKEFLQFALRCYTNIYEKERLPVDKLDEGTCLYMIAELNRRVGNKDDSIKWFSRFISSPDARKNPTLLDMAREQFQLAKEG